MNTPNLDAMIYATKEAEHVLSLADSVKDKIVELLVGRLRGINSVSLHKLKRELKDFNSHTYTWRGEE